MKRLDAIVNIFAAPKPCPSGGRRDATGRGPASKSAITSKTTIPSVAFEMAAGDKTVGFRPTAGGGVRISGMRWILTLLLAFASFVSAQTKPTQAEIDQWKKEPNILESSACKKITWLLEAERTASAEVLPK